MRFWSEPQSVHWRKVSVISSFNARIQAQHQHGTRRIGRVVVYPHQSTIYKGVTTAFWLHWAGFDVFGFLLAALKRIGIPVLWYGGAGSPYA